MKKNIFMLLFCISLILCSCRKNDCISIKTFPLTFDISFSYCDTDYKIFCETCDDFESMNMTFLYPNELENIKYEFSKDNQNINCFELQTVSQTNSFPKIIFNILTDAKDKIASRYDENYLIEGNAENQPYKIVVAPTSYPLFIIIENFGIKAEIENLALVNK